MSPELKEITWYEAIDEFKVYVALIALSWCMFLKFLWKVMFFVPTIRSIFESMNVELPLLTRALLRSNDILCNFWFLILPTIFYFCGRYSYNILLDLKKNGLGPKGLETRVRCFITVMSIALGLLVIEGLAYYYVYSPMLKLITCVG